MHLIVHLHRQDEGQGCAGKGPNQIDKQAELWNDQRSCGREQDQNCAQYQSFGWLEGAQSWQLLIELGTFYDFKDWHQLHGVATKQSKAVEHLDH